MIYFAYPRRVLPPRLGTARLYLDKPPPSRRGVYLARLGRTTHHPASWQGGLLRYYLLYLAPEAVIDTRKRGRPLLHHSVLQRSFDARLAGLGAALAVKHS